VTFHRQDSIWYATGDFRTAITGLVTDVQFGNNYIQVNDASLPLGGSYTPEEAQMGSDSAGVLVETPWRAHRSHALGIDVDLGLCYAASPGMDADQDERQSPPCTATPEVDLTLLRLAAGARGLRVILEGGDLANHFHLRPFNTLAFEGLVEH
jgi:hypothetical protein